LLRIALFVVLGLVFAATAFALLAIGPRNLIGMLRYDRRKEGDLRVGTRAPDLELVALDGGSRVRLLGAARGRPLVIVFGSFT